MNKLHLCALDRFGFRLFTYGMLLVALSIPGVPTASADIAWNNWTVNEPILDNDGSGMQDTQTLSGFSNVIESIEVRMRFTGDPVGYNGDYYVSLQSANGGYAVLLNRPGRTSMDLLGYDNSGFDVTFTLTGDDIHMYHDYGPSYDVDGRLIGTWGADARNVDPDDVLDTDPRTANLDSFIGMDPNGEWTLFVADMNQNATATFNSWGLGISVVPEPATISLLGLGGLLFLRRRWLA